MNQPLLSILDRAVQHHQAGQLAEALSLYREVLALDPGCADAHVNLAQIFLQRGEAAAALGHARSGVELAPGSPLGRLNLGAALLALFRNEEALPHLQQAVALQPDLYQAHNNLGTALYRLRRTDEAIASHERALTLRLDHAGAHNNLGLCLHERLRHADAIAHLLRATVLAPGDADAHCNLAGVLVDTGAVEEGLAAYGQALELNPQHWEAHSGRLLALHYSDATTPQRIAAEHRRFGALAEQAARARTQPACAPAPRTRQDRRRLRVGYVSGDLREHSVAYFIEPLLRAHDRAAVELYCYSTTRRTDAVSVRLAALADRFCDVSRDGPGALHALVQQDQVDILVDLAGHTRDNRLLEFACRAAPVQVTYLGYPDTTGLAAMDYRLTDAWADPPHGPDDLYTERLYRLPRCFLCYQPPDGAPAVAPPPCRERGAVTFGSFNNRPKLGPRALSCFAAVLRAVPGSRLLLKSQCFADAASVEQVRRIFAGHGIAPERVRTLGLVASVQAHLQRYAEVDIALDSFPYNGTTTTCEALYMGVPVVSLCGQTHAGRVGLSLLSQVGLAELVAAQGDQAHYVALAVELAQDPARLGLLRGELRERLRASPLMDAAGHARSIEAAYEFMIRRSGAAAAIPGPGGIPGEKLL